MEVAHVRFGKERDIKKNKGVGCCAYIRGVGDKMLQVIQMLGEGVQCVRGRDEKRKNKNEGCCLQRENKAVLRSGRQ